MNYGHHPTEIKETLTAKMRQIWKDRLIVVASRTGSPEQGRSLMNSRKLSGMSNILIINDIYPASEEPIAGIIPQHFARLSGQTGQKCEIYPQAEGTIKYLLKTVKAKDTVATGAGSIYKIGEAFFKTTGGRENKKK